MKTQYVQGYVRYQEDSPEKQTKTNNESGFVVASTLVGGTSLLLAYIFIKVVLALLSVVVISYYTQKLVREYKEHRNRPHLDVNINGKHKVVFL